MIESLVDVSQLACLTADEPGIGGQIKRRPEDFVVDEEPLYEWSGDGDHLILHVEKRRRLTTDLVRYLSRHFQRPRKSVGFAGLKDKHAVTRQYISIEHANPDLARTFDDGYIRILGVDRHRNKIKRGHLAGNRFVIKVRDVEPASVLTAKRIMDRLSAEGAPNYLGEQRFGYRRDSHLLGRCLMVEDWQGFLDRHLGMPSDNENEKLHAARRAYEAGEYDKALELWPTVHRFERQAIGPLTRGASPRDAVHGIDRVQRYLLISAWQSAIFNQLCHRRVADGDLARLRAGDVAFLHASRGVFDVTDPQVEQPRCDGQEISPSGPMWGWKMRRASGDELTAECRALEASGVTIEQLRDGEYQPEGSRRAYRMLLRDAEVAGGADEHGPYVQLSFMLGRGSYATTVLREITKAG